MATNFPTSLDTYTNPTSTDALTSPSHADQHANVNDAVEALEAKVGIDSSAVNTTHDFKLSGVATADKAVSLTGTETLTNKTLTSPTINTPTITALNISDEQFTVSDNADSTKALVFELSGATTVKTATITSSHTDDRTITLPDATDTLVGKATTDTLTNKTIDANGTGNSISNLEVADFAATAIVIESEGISSNDNDTTLPTSAAVKDYVDTQSSGTNVATDGNATIDDGTANEVNIVSTTIAAGTLGTTNAIKVRVLVSNLSLSSGSSDPIIRLKYGSTTLVTTTLTTTSNYGPIFGYVDAYLIADGSTSSQDGTVVVDLSANNLDGDTTQVAYVRSFGSGASAEDSTGALTLALTLQFGDASSDNDFEISGYIVEKVLV